MLKIEDSYQVYKNYDLTDKDFQSLFLLYEALIGKESLNVYLFLYYDFKTNNHQDICQRLNLNIDQFYLHRLKCEEFKLIKTFKHKTNNKYVYQLCKPMNIDSFLSDDIYSRLLAKKISGEKLEYLAKLKGDRFITKDFIDVSSMLSLNELEDWDLKQEEKFKKINIEKESLIFNIKKMLSNVSELVFPTGLRTIENLNEIQRIGEIYGIDTERMIKFLSEVVDYFDQTIDLKTLEFKARNCQVFDFVNEDNPYMMSCIQFLSNHCKFKPTAYDKYLINFLSNEYKLSHYLINILLEYTLKVCENRLPKKYLESIASYWNRNKVNTIEQALESLKQNNTKQKQVITMEYEKGSDDFDFKELSK